MLDFGNVGQKVCALCKVDKDLKKSHFMPQALYKEIGKSKLQSESPILIRTKRKSAAATDRQYAKLLLCGGCEQLFSTRECVLSKYWCRRSGFLLKKELEADANYRSGSGQRFFNTYPEVTLSEDVLYYFAISILWRSSQGDWGDYKELQGLTDQLVEQMRLYLLGEAQPPSDIKVRVYVDWNGKVDQLLILPSSDGRTVQFVMLGLVVEFLIKPLCGNPLIGIMADSGQLVDMVLDDRRCSEVYKYVKRAAINSQ